MKNLFPKFKFDDKEFSNALDDFINSFTNVTRFEYLDQENYRAELWEIIFCHLKNKDHHSIHKNCLIALRILSRDKTNLDNILSKEKLDLILEYSGLGCKQEHYTITAETTEAQKLLCNLLFNSLKVQSIITETLCLESVIDRISKYDDNTLHDTKLFDVRTVFLITALNASTRDKVSYELFGDIHLIEFLQTTFNNFNTKDQTTKDNSAVLICEVLKTLFNLLIASKDLTTKEIESYKTLSGTLKKLLLQKDEKHKHSFESNVINLLTVVPNDCFANLITIDSNDTTNILEYEDMDMIVIDILVKALDKKLNCDNNEIENLSPILTSFIKMCKMKRLIRKYVRMQILPPLKDVMTRPEEGSTLRNKLCKYLTSPITEIKDLVAEFLFILCKEKVGRMIKYTGYGNAAGMFANKGLLGSETVDYSSDSESSDTEEYEKLKNQINPVTGCYESPKPNPFENMTEEQKEYEAMKLVGLVDKLQRGGVIQPCRIEDGKPIPIEHVLELEEHLPKQQIHRMNSESE